MRPLAQTFLINEPNTGSEAVFVTAIDLYFRAKPSITTLGVEVQIRETLNGVPLSKQLPYASKRLSASAINVSSDASVSTRFVFDTPVLVRTNELVAIAVISAGGSPEYALWTARRDGVDVTPDTSGSLVVFPNNVGNLYAPSNDLSYTPIANECLKFSLVTANFTSSSGVAAFKSADLEFFNAIVPAAGFATNEKVMVSNNYLKLASMTVSAMGTPFTVGEIVVQPNTATNIITATSYGTVYFANTTALRLKDVGGTQKFSTTGSGLRGLTSGFTTANPTAAFVNVATTSGANVITVPTANTPDSDFVTGNFIYVGKSNWANVQVARVVSVDVPTRQITLDRNINYTESDAVHGRIKSDGNLYGLLSFDVRSKNFAFIGLHNSSANATQNFASSANQVLIGTESGTTANVSGLVSIFYDSITSQISAIDSKDSNVVFSFKGYNNNSVSDSDYSEIFNEIPYEFIDKERYLYSKSAEVLSPFNGNNTLTMRTNLTSSTSKFSPYIDLIRTNAIVTSNEIMPKEKLIGYYLNIENANGKFDVGTTVWQANASSNTAGKVSFSNNSFIAVYDVASSNSMLLGQFNANNISIVTGAGGVTANVTAVKVFNEALGNGSKLPSRYVSKTVVLAEGQDSEDLAVFLTAYRPPGTDIKVYGKLLNATDSDPFNDKSWSPLINSTETLFSSLVERNDYVELKFELPQTVAVHTSNISVNTTSAIINFTNSKTTESFTPGMFVYVSDSTTKTFAVRRIVEVPNTTSLIAASNLTFLSANAAIGYMPEMMAQCNAFRNNLNNGIVRYVCKSTDSAFDSYKTFAIKIVLTADSTQVVPRVADMRALALQI